MAPMKAPNISPSVKAQVEELPKEATELVMIKLYDKQLTGLESCFAGVKTVLLTTPINIPASSRWIGQIKNYRERMRDFNQKRKPPKVGLVGGTGVGKSALSNCIIEKEIMPSSNKNSEAVTAIPTVVMFNDDRDPEKLLQYEVKYLNKKDHAKTINSLKQELNDQDKIDSNGIDGVKFDLIWPCFNVMDINTKSTDEWLTLAERKWPEIGTKKIGHSSNWQTFKEEITPFICASAKDAEWHLIKNITLFIKSDFLKEVTLVDFPGADDVNVARGDARGDHGLSSIVILSRFDRANADKTALNFLYDHTLGPGLSREEIATKSEQVIFAISKGDTIFEPNFDKYLSNTKDAKAYLNKKLPNFFADYTESQKKEEELMDDYNADSLDITQASQEKQLLVDKAKEILVPWAIDDSRCVLQDHWETTANRKLAPISADSNNHDSKPKARRIEAGFHVIGISVDAFESLKKRKRHISSIKGYKTIADTGIPLLKNRILLGSAKSCIVPAIPMYEQGVTLIEELDAFVNSHAFNERISEKEKSIMIEQSNALTKHLKHVATDDISFNFNELMNYVDTFEVKLRNKIPDIQDKWGQVWEDFRKDMVLPTFKAISRRFVMGETTFTTNKGKVYCFLDPIMGKYNEAIDADCFALKDMFQSTCTKILEELRHRLQTFGKNRSDAAVLYCAALEGPNSNLEFELPLIMDRIKQKSAELFQQISKATDDSKHEQCMRIEDFLFSTCQAINIRARQGGVGVFDKLKEIGRSKFQLQSGQVLDTVITEYCNAIRASITAKRSKYLYFFCEDIGEEINTTFKGLLDVASVADASVLKNAIKELLRSFTTTLDQECIELMANPTINDPQLRKDSSRVKNLESTTAKAGSRNISTTSTTADTSRVPNLGTPINMSSTASITPTVVNNKRVGSSDNFSDESTKKQKVTDFALSNATESNQIKQEDFNN